MYSMEKDDIMNQLISKIEQLTFENQLLKKQLQNYQKCQVKCPTHQCPNGHQMQFKEVKQMEPIYCDKCQELINDFSRVRWECDRCDYDQCYQCGGYEKQFCLKKHKLVKKKMVSVICNICLQSYNNQWTYQCRECDYDICSQCSK